jgi:hypothetical protein
MCTTTTATRTRTVPSLALVLTSCPVRRRVRALGRGINLVLSGSLNHKKNEHKFGCGLTIGGA